MLTVDYRVGVGRAVSHAAILCLAYYCQHPNCIAITGSTTFVVILNELSSLFATMSVCCAPVHNTASFVHLAQVSCKCHHCFDHTCTREKHGHSFNKPVIGMGFGSARDAVLVVF